MKQLDLASLNAVQRFAILERIWARVAKGDGFGCWEWTASATKAGYGQLRVGTSPRYVHRLVYELSIGDIPDGMFVCHRCDNRRCCKPSHLFLGTAADNSRDMAQKNRSTRGRPQPLGAHVAGESHGRRKLTAKQVQEIRARYAAGGVTQEKIAAEFGVSGAHVCGIVNGKFWKEDVSPLRAGAE